jgi:iron(III) transport system ATP-binding protein
MFLEVSQLEVRYRGSAQAAVHGVTLGLRTGDIGVLIGPSGCGKTTLLRAVAGLEPVNGGEIRLSGQVVSSASVQLAPEARRIGMVFQDYALFPHLDVGRNVAFGIAQLPRAERDLRVREVLALVGLAGSESRYPHELSGGQQQRVALARALAPRPQLLLLDEPFSNLDVELRERLAHEVRNILKEAKATALLHQWDDAYTLYHRPATRFVADFIGHGVFAPATIREVNRQIVVQTPLGELTDMAECPLPCAFAGGECDVLLRADDIVHDDAAPVKAEIIRKAFRGSEFLYTLRLAGGQTVMAHVPSHHDHKIGEWIGIRPEVDHVVTFNRACSLRHGAICDKPCTGQQTACADLA